MTPEEEKALLERVIYICVVAGLTLTGLTYIVKFIDWCRQ